MPAPSTYSLSSGFRDAPSSPTTKKKRVSAHLVGRLVGSKSGVSPPERRRSVSDDSVSKAAAWMWHTRGISEATVLPTKQLPRRVQVVEASNNAPSSEHHESAESNARNLQPSRFKVEACKFLAAVQAPAAPHDDIDQLHTGSSKDTIHRQSPAPEPATSTSNVPEGKYDHGKQPSTFLYDQFELFSLQREIDKLRSAQPSLVSDHGMMQSPACTDVSSSTSSPSRQIKLLSAIQKLFRKVYTSARNSKSGPSGFGRGPSKTEVGSVQHVIHHHHHHFHHYSLPQSAPASHDDLRGDGVVSRRRRANSESCSEAQRERLIRRVPVYQPDNDDDDDQWLNDQMSKHGGSRLGTSVRRHSHCAPTSSRLHPILEWNDS